jgi:hypothetical protein
VCVPRADPSRIPAYDGDFADASLRRKNIFDFTWKTSLLARDNFRKRHTKRSFHHTDTARLGYAVEDSTAKAPSPLSRAEETDEGPHPRRQLGTVWAPGGRAKATEKRTHASGVPGHGSNGVPGVPSRWWGGPRPALRFRSFQSFLFCFPREVTRDEEEPWIGVVTGPLRECHLALGIASACGPLSLWIATTFFSSFFTSLLNFFRNGNLLDWLNSTHQTTRYYQVHEPNI